MRVLGIETSCDETGAAVYDTAGGLLGHALHSQVALHRPYGGVVPELASRDHVRHLVPLIQRVLRESATALADLDGIAFTEGPGLAGALLVGASVASALAYAIGRPAIGIHHLEGHLLSPLLSDPRPDFPFVALLVSGGHSQLFEVAGAGRYRLLGDTQDDAAGEAFDKTAKLLGLPYPGGPALARLAESGSEESAGELLREHAERVARSSPRLGRRWAEQLASVRFEDGLLAAYARWSAGVVHHLGGEPGRAERELKSAARAMARAGRPDLADRVRLLLVDVYGEQLRLRRARTVARQLELRFAARGDRERGAVALANLGCAEDAADRVDRAQALWHQAARRLEPGSLRHLLARANLANSAALAGRFAEAMSEHRAVAEAARDLGLPELALQAELNLAEGEFATGLVDAALGR